ncbi:glycosyltransferase [Paraburkholderia aspalathi]|uniref:Glycosyltransferase involved in cell wall bisynthesis n=1 Tax=Paraburkholderia aspalathi TaxID=1324617 RepID=A0A1I7E7U1_9BURK|nr:glycosyltransferase [Paraburkholderia aspalathi]SFU20000.1 Glycosyltransferase involved in cell wall bisynthesis [Paraburkholderia aspalathi]
MKKKKVMFVITGLNMGGAENQIVLIVRELCQLGWEVAVVSLIAPRYFVDELEAFGASVYSMNMTPGVADLRAILKFVFLVRKWRPQIIHSHMYHANVFARIARIFFRNIPLVSTAHNIDEFEGSRLKILAYRLTSRLSTYMTNVSQAGYFRYVYLKIIDSKKGGFIPNGVDTERFDWNSATRSKVRNIFDVKDEFVWLAIGRLVPAKDFENLIAALAELRERGCSKFRVFIVGEGPQEFILKQRVIELDLANNVIFLGARRDVPELMCAADAFVMSSAWEGLPMVILEAMASGRIVVATDVGGVGELVTPQVGRLIPPHQPVALACQMWEVMQLSNSEKEKAEKLARTFVRNEFSIKDVALRWVEVYNKVK